MKSSEWILLIPFFLQILAMAVYVGLCTYSCLFMAKDKFVHTTHGSAGKKSEVNNSIYENYGDRWYTAFDDPIALLRAESKAKTPWILKKIRSHFSDALILDVGCGGGFLSNALAKEGFQVTGVDLSPESLKVAARFDSTGRVKYLVADAFQLPFADGSFEVLTALDFLEHIEDPARVIQEFSRVLKPGGLFIFHTFNRNPIAWLVIIKFVEWLVDNTPSQMHVLRLFIKPRELSDYCLKANLTVREMIGIKPVVGSIPLGSIFSGTIPPGMRFELTRCLLLSYMGCAQKS